MGPEAGPAEAVARPCKAVDFITASATRSDTSRIRRTDGNTWPLPRSSEVRQSARARAEAYRVVSVILSAPETVDPSPSPGKINMLLHWEGTRVLPSMLTAPKGDPLANTQAPPVQPYACSAVHSALAVGLLKGKIIPRPPLATAAPCTVSTNSFVKSCGTALRPRRTVGPAALAASSKVIPSFTTPSPSGCAKFRAAGSSSLALAGSERREAPMSPSLSQM
mmetsp:Transcript_38745/g.86519  ORF Transcript_38745/g.86519 Transcript_38745/m.86519 type:complete len:222 (-) Transcript_38745:1299-1964(-)